jgi:hypothetical protein
MASNPARSSYRSSRSVDFGVVGYAMVKAGMPLAPLILGLILGDQIELNLIRAIMTDGDPWLFATQPISGGLLLGRALRGPQRAGCGGSGAERCWRSSATRNAASKRIGTSKATAGREPRNFGAHARAKASGRGRLEERASASWIPRHWAAKRRLYACRPAAAREDLLALRRTFRLRAA